jgi:hypothetical protein
MKLRGLVISKTELKCSVFQFLHWCICKRFIYSQHWSAEDKSWKYIIRSQVHACRNWERGCAVSLLGIYVSNFRYSVRNTVRFCRAMIYLLYIYLLVPFYKRLCESLLSIGESVLCDFEEISKKYYFPICFELNHIENGSRNISSEAHLKSSKINRRSFLDMEGSIFFNIFKFYLMI